MNSNDIKKKTNDPPARGGTPVQNPATQPHGTTQDQVNEMESEGQAAKQGQSRNPLPPAQKQDEHKGAVEGDHAIAEDSIGARADETQG